ncbi:3'-5' exoribonuclease, partial [Enterobacter kobei]|nr:3'-5' exoribonuclease [Enterobacter kobei]
ERGKAMEIHLNRNMPFEATRHSALDDAIHQVKYVSAIWQKLIK